MRWRFLPLLVGLLLTVVACSGDDAGANDDDGGGGAGAGLPGTPPGKPPGNPGPLPPASGSSGCGLDAVTGTFQQTVEAAGKQRTFFVSIPESYDPERAYPLVFGYHGGDDFGGEAMRGYLDLERVEPIGSELFVYPDATAVNDPGGTGFEYGTTLEAQADDAFFDAILAIMSSNYCVDDNRIFVTGQSAGGGYAGQIACHRGDVVRAAVPVAANLVLCGGDSCIGWGGIHPTGCVGAPSVLQMHSPDDWIEYNPFGLGTFELLASAAGCGVWDGPEVAIADLGTAAMEATTTPTCERRLGCDSEVVLCSYSGGHQIPGWDGPSEFEYQQVTMDFFRSH
jgi:hypothetical protein